MLGVSAHVPITDGRRARGDRTRTRLLESLLALAAEGNVRPTAQDVAVRAGVALRSVYYHFEDVGALRLAALLLAESRAASLVLDDGPASGDLQSRIALVARWLRRRFEATGPIREVLLCNELDSSEATGELRRIRRRRRVQLEDAFGPELERFGERRNAVLDAIDSASSWEAWAYLRLNLKRPAPAAERVFATSLTALLLGK